MRTMLAIVAAATVLLVGLVANGFDSKTNKRQIEPIRTGTDVLVERDFAPLAGQRVGLITNPTGLTADWRSTIDVLYEAPNVELVALFGPEHGVRGAAPAGIHVDHSRDAKTGLPVYSLHGPTRKPTPTMLAELDVLVFDIQDIGSRSYTYISTMALAQEAAAENGVRFVVLDRPNPLTGNKVEGRPLDLAYRSFVGHLPIPYVHGMTVGELARMINGEGWLAGGIQADLEVIPMRNWSRDMWFDQTSRLWVPTSPHVPHAATASYYAATGIMGELRVLSEGVGYPLPFELVGAPWIDPDRLADELNSRRLPGLHFRPASFEPYYASFAKETCGGVHIIFTDRDRAELTPIQFHVMDVVRKLYPDHPLFTGKRDAMFDKVCGTDQVRKMWEAGRPLADILKVWRSGVDEFCRRRQPYLLYD